MDVILISAKALLPLFAFMMLGYYFQKRKYLSESTTKQINIIVFRYFLSIMCAETIYKANLKEDVELLPVLMFAGGIISIFLISWLIVPRFVKDKTQIPVMIQGIYKSNYAILGIPIAQSICGADNIGIVSVIAVILVPLNNAISAFIFEKYTGNATSVPKLLLNIIKNPLVVGSLAGLVLNVVYAAAPSDADADLETGILDIICRFCEQLPLLGLNSGEKEGRGGAAARLGVDRKQLRCEHGVVILVYEAAENTVVRRVEIIKIRSFRRVRFVVDGELQRIGRCVPERHPVEFSGDPGEFRGKTGSETEFAVLQLCVARGFI